MNPRTSLYVQTLAKCGSVTRAADQLFITPSALSKYIGILEKEVGTELFSRVGKQFVLTHAGERYLDWCTRIDALTVQMKQEMYDISGQKAGKIRIGTQYTISDFLAGRVVPDFMKQYPGVCVSLTEDIGDHILDQMKQFKLDAAISTKPPNSDQFWQENVLTMEPILIVPREHQLVKRAVQKAGYLYPWVDLEWCRGERFVMLHPGQTPRSLADAMLAPILDDIQIVLEVRSMRTIIEAVENRIGITQSASHMDRLFGTKWNDLVKLSFGEHYPPITYSLYYHKNIYCSNALHAFLDIARAKFRTFEQKCQ